MCNNENSTKKQLEFNYSNLNLTLLNNLVFMLCFIRKKIIKLTFRF
jgi:hypothetical protein